MNVGNSFSSGLPSGQVYHTSVPNSPLSRVSSAPPSHVPALHVPSIPVTYSFAPTLTPSGRSDLINCSNSVANLVKPSSFLASCSSSSYLMPQVSSISTTALHPLLNLQQPYGTPMLQPFPPPTPPPTLTANPPPVTGYGSLNREKVRDALLMLVRVCCFNKVLYFG